MSLLPSSRAARASLLITAILVTACGSGNGASSTSPSASSAASPGPSAEAAASSSESVSIAGFAFAPATLSVPAGTTVVWTNDEDALHTVTSGAPDARDELFDSGEIDTGVTFSHVFETPGTYAYFCDRHEFMAGTVTVTP